MAMVVGPAPHQRVELTNELHLTQSARFSDTLPHLGQEDLDVLPGGPDKQLVLELAEVLAEEVEPCAIGVMQVFSCESSSPRSRMNCSTSGRTSFSNTSREAPVMMKSSAYLTKATLGLMFFPRHFVRLNAPVRSVSNPSSVRFASSER